MALLTPNVLMLAVQLIFSCLHHNYAVLCSMPVWGGGTVLPPLILVLPVYCLSLKSFGHGISQWMEVNINKANNFRYNPATFIVLWGTVLPPDILGRAIYYFFYSKHCHLSCDEGRRLVAKLCAIIILYFIVHVRCRHKESSYSLSHLLMSFVRLWN